MKEKWLDTPLSYRVVILFHAALMLLFILLYATLGRQYVVRHEDELFRYRKEGDTLTYTGKLNGKEAVLTMLPDGSLECLLDGVRYGPYTVTEDPSAVPEASDVPSRVLTGIEVREGDEVLFRGGFYGTGILLFYNSNGERYTLPSQEMLVSNDMYGTVYSSELIEPSLRTVLRFTIAPDPVYRGTVGFLLLGLFCSLACILSTFFAEELFRHNLRFSIKNAENAEPSDWELMSRWISWIVFTAVALAFYIGGLSAPVLN